MYYALYSLLTKTGVKSEIHKCSILLMDFFEEYSAQDKKDILDAFELRNNMQYYVDKIIDEKIVKKLYASAPAFVTKTQNILFSLDNKKTEEIRAKIFKK